MSDPIKELAGQPKTRQERLAVITEVKMKCIEHDLTNNVATKVLFSMLDKYLEGETYINKRLTLNLRGDRKREYIVNLHNLANKKDTVLIRNLP